eukprot:TRINITY_DN0_c48_g1_i1.p1 TRINITY_DN0_c48_g1~~TRINITY_DN0_c48_g1_i1.p1  ORF type:complete len:243 (-),score=29.45 TRINITY_DN0_c48_g1_i1:661-1389(-)
MCSTQVFHYLLILFSFSFFFFFKQKTAYEMLRSLVGSEMCIRDRYQRRVRGSSFIYIKKMENKKLLKSNHNHNPQVKSSPNHGVTTPKQTTFTQPSTKLTPKTNLTNNPNHGASNNVTTPNNKQPAPQFRIEPMAQHPQYLKHVAQRIYEEWKVYYAKYNLFSVDDIFNDLVSSRLEVDKLPIYLVCLNGDDFVGSILLENEDGMDNTIYAGLTPWITNLYVESKYRRQLLRIGGIPKFPPM